MQSRQLLENHSLNILHYPQLVSPPVSPSSHPSLLCIDMHSCVRYLGSVSTLAYPDTRIGQALFLSYGKQPESPKAWMQTNMPECTLTKTNISKCLDTA